MPERHERETGEGDESERERDAIVAHIKRASTPPPPHPPPQTHGVVLMYTCSDLRRACACG
jgi:hypothetical protein